MDHLTRRMFSKQTLGSMLTFSLLETLFGNDLFANAIRPLTSKWVADLDALGRDVKGQKISQIDWQHKVEALFASVSLPDLLTFIDFDKLTRGVKMADSGARSLRFKFPEVEGIPKRLVFGQQIFALKRGRSVVPHGHNNMATAFLAIGGELHGRHYDRLEDTEDHFIIRPTIDRTFGPGEFSSVSDYKDNVHWFKAISEPAYIFNIHILNTRPDSKLKTGRVYCNPDGEKLKGGLIRAPRISYSQAHRLFG